MMTMDTMRADKQPLYNNTMLSMRHHFAMFGKFITVEKGLKRKRLKNRSGGCFQFMTVKEFDSMFDFYKIHTHT